MKVLHKRLWLGRVSVAAVMLILSSAVFAQTVIRTDQIPCSEEIVRSNLEVKEKLHFSGELKDATGFPFADSKVFLNVNDSKGRFIFYRSAVTTKDGRFDLGLVDAGKYRFLPAPNRGFKQPKQVKCDEGPDCELSVVLQVNPTDQPFAGCPIQ